MNLRNPLLKRGKSYDPAGMPPKILSSGRIISLRVGVTLPSDSRVLGVLGGIHFVQRRTVVTAIRFSPTPLPDLSKSTGE